MSDYVRPQLDEAKREAVRLALEKFKKRDVSFKKYMLKFIEKQFDKLVDECEGHRIAHQLPLLTHDIEFGLACSELQKAINNHEYDLAAQIMYTQNAMLILEINQQRRAEGNRSMLEYAS
jgi:hypothetical protein